jgi:hypothetical protein
VFITILHRRFRRRGQWGGIYLTQESQWEGWYIFDTGVSVGGWYIFDTGVSVGGWYIFDTGVSVGGVVYI